MKIAIEATLGQGHATGFGQYVKCLLREFAAMKTGDSFLLFHSTKEWRGDDYGANFHPVSYYCFKQSAGITFRLNYLLKKHHADLFHATCTTGMPPRLDIPGITTVHDLYPRLHPEECGALQSYCFNLLLRWTVRNSRHFLCNSEFTANELSRMLDIASGKITVTSLAPVISDSIASKPVNRTGILCVGAIEPRKNQLTLLKAYRAALKTRPDLPPLTFIGPDRGDGVELDRMIATPEMRDKVTHHCYMDEKEIASWYRKAALFAFPSRYEGFGLPLLEAIRFGLPVICGDIAVLHEIGGDYPCYLDPNDQEAWRVALLAGTPEANPELADKQLSKFSWRRCAEQTLSAYRELLR